MLFFKNIMTKLAYLEYLTSQFKKNIFSIYFLSEMEVLAFLKHAAFFFAGHFVLIYFFLFLNISLSPKMVDTNKVFWIDLKHVSTDNYKYKFCHLF